MEATKVQALYLHSASDYCLSGSGIVEVLTIECKNGMQILSGWPPFGSVTVRAWNGSSGFGFRFRQFLFGKGAFCAFHHSSR